MVLSMKIKQNVFLDVQVPNTNRSVTQVKGICEILLIRNSFHNPLLIRCWKKNHGNRKRTIAQKVHTGRPPTSEENVERIRKAFLQSLGKFVRTTST